MDLEQKKNHVPILNHAINVIEVLSRNEKGISMPEVEKLCSISKTSAFRIITTLYDRDYVVRNETTKCYSLSRKLLSLGLSALNENNIVEEAIDNMRALRDFSRETVLIGVIVNNEGVVLEQILGNHPFRFSVDYGTRFNLFSTAGGKSILAFLPENEINKIVDEAKLVKYTENTIISKKKLLAELKMIREQGFAIDNAEETLGVHCVGAPVFNEKGYPIASIWTTGPSGRLTAERFSIIGNEVQKQALEISTKLGFKN
jgi:DNA-binding IclR family transcriptional regulator